MRVWRRSCWAGLLRVSDLVERALLAGLPVLQTYGMTETGSQVATVERGTALQALGTAGPPLDGFTVSIEAGEILVDGPAVSPGYVGEPPTGRRSPKRRPWVCRRERAGRCHRTEGRGHRDRGRERVPGRS